MTGERTTGKFKIQIYFYIGSYPPSLPCEGHIISNQKSPGCKRRKEDFKRLTDHSKLIRSQYINTKVSTFCQLQTNRGDEATAGKVADCKTLSQSIFPKTND